VIHISARGASDVGKRREQNEDAIGIDEPAGIFLVADGMGGHQHGEVASRETIGAMHKKLSAAKGVFDRFRDDPTDASQAAAVAAVVKAVEETCAHVFELGGRSGASRTRMGSTLDAVVRVGDRVILAHVGDGRIHLLRGGRCYRLTEDHTLVAEQIKAGLLKESEAEESTFKGVLTRAIGTHRSVKVDTLILDLSPGDVLLMCTDGLHRYAGADDLARLLGPTPAPAMVGKLIEHANAQGGADNVSAVMIACAPPREEAGVAKPAQKSLSKSVGAGRIEAVCALPMFQHLSYREQVAVLSVARSRTFEAGATVVKQGDVGSEMFIILEGRLEVSRDGVKIAELGKGGHFGEMSLVDDARRSASVKALTATEVLSIGQIELNGLMRVEPVLGVKVLWSFVQVLSTRLRTASKEIIELQMDQAPPTSLRPPFGA
jgi:serine/threonine protein phosphatase PrpC